MSSLFARNVTVFLLLSARDKPVVRKHTVVHVMDWLKDRMDDVGEDEFSLVLVSGSQW